MPSEEFTSQDIPPSIPSQIYAEFIGLLEHEPALTQDTRSSLQKMCVSGSITNTDKIMSLIRKQVEKQE